MPTSSQAVYIQAAVLQPLQQGTVIFDKFPNITWHGNKYMRVGPDERLYIDLGAPCNDCLLENAVGNVSFGSLNSMRLDGTDLQPYATGAPTQHLFRHCQRSLSGDPDDHVGEIREFLLL